MALIGPTFFIRFRKVFIKELNVLFINSQLSEIIRGVFWLIGGKEEECLFLGRVILLNENCHKVVLSENFIVFVVFIVEVEYHSDDKRKRTGEKRLKIT